MKQDMCPVCSEPFKEGEALIQFIEWSEKATAQTNTRLGHVDCVLYISRMEGRKKHPPLDTRGTPPVVR
jgi:hypothetical protein